jgi:hypothetical protein
MNAGVDGSGHGEGHERAAEPAAKICGSYESHTRATGLAARVPGFETSE